jgi:hypothetical protein
MLGEKNTHNEEKQQVKGSKKKTRKVKKDA